MSKIPQKGHNRGGRIEGFADGLDNVKAIGSKVAGELPKKGTVSGFGSVDDEQNTSAADYRSRSWDKNNGGIGVQVQIRDHSPITGKKGKWK